MNLCISLRGILKQLGETSWSMGVLHVQRPVNFDCECYMRVLKRCRC